MLAVATSPLILRRVLFGNPERESVTVSRDGARIAYLAPLDGVLNVWVAPIRAVEDALPVTRETERGIRAYFWTHNPSYILYVQDAGGDENWHVYAANVETGDTRDLTPYEQVHALPEPLSDRFPDEALININHRDPQFHDLYRVNILTGESSCLLRNDIGAAGFVTDRDFNVRLALVSTADGGTEYHALSQDGQWELTTTVEREDSLTTFPLGYDSTSRTLYMFDSRRRDTSALVEIDTLTGQERELALDPSADAQSVMIDPSTRRVQAVAFEYDRVTWHVLDQSIAADIDRISDESRGDFGVASRTRDDSIWVVEYDRDDGPKSFYLYHRRDGRLEFLFTNRPELEQANLASMRTAIVKTGDGLDIVVYYSLPVDSRPAGSDFPSEPLPAVLLVHGGPWARDSWGYDAEHQLLANRGYAVISVNYRGSTGFGKAFVNAGDLEWAGKMHDDLIDVVNWSVDCGIADRDRIAIMGGSYGGYATLVGLTFTPEVFACGVDIVGPSNLNTLLESVPPYWEPVIALFKTRVGDNSTGEGRRFLAGRSPLSKAERIVRPLLIGQGANDPRVKQAESDQIVEAMTDRGIPVTYILYPDEGHGFARPENNLSFVAAAEAFLAKCLGGRYEPIADDLEGSTITVVAGASEVPGLESALLSNSETQHRNRSSQ